MGEKMLVTIGGAVLALIGAYIANVSWELHRLDELCTEVSPGSPSDSVVALAKAHGFKRVVTGRVKQGEDVWETFVVAPSSMGDESCDILHDRSVVLSVKRFSG